MLRTVIIFEGLGFRDCATLGCSYVAKGCENFGVITSLRDDSLLLSRKVTKFWRNYNLVQWFIIVVAQVGENFSI